MRTPAVVRRVCWKINVLFHLQLLEIDMKRGMELSVNVQLLEIDMTRGMELSVNEMELGCKHRS